MTPGFVGADLNALTAEAGGAAMRRIYQTLKVTPTPSFDMDLDDPPPPTQGPLLASPEPKSIIQTFLNAYPDRLTEEQLSPLYITLPDFLTALPKIQPSSKREGFATVPDVTWADIGALRPIRMEMQMAIVQPIKRPELYASVGITAPTGVLLWGPPGCGKTLLAKAVANESRANFISIRGPELLNKVLPRLFSSALSREIKEYRVLTASWTPPVRRRIRTRRPSSLCTRTRIHSLRHLLRRARRPCPSPRRQPLGVLRSRRKYSPHRTRRPERPSRNLCHWRHQPPRRDRPCNAKAGEIR